MSIWRAPIDQQHDQPVAAPYSNVGTLPVSNESRRPVMGPDGKPIELPPPPPAERIGFVPWRKT